ncbi:VWA domain-containing protein [Paenibacillus pinihumi]|uniref:VWA domain-containing protein n=1 Tax=Paenibacillus pinihumi TaxID=669462 RepID=UPI00041093E7|nr:VWA domain-containing protein [Paenibacillus pinihumi]
MKSAETDVVFVMDTSFSMNKTDQDRIAIEVINMFMDMSEAARTRFGLVAYNDKIVARETLSSKSGIKRQIESLRRSGYSDLGLGLKEGAKLLGGTGSEGRNKLLILLSDGDIELGPVNRGRTAKSSEADVGQAIKLARDSGYPIYAVGLNSDGSVREERLQQIAKQTGGSAFITDSAEDLPEIFNQIFATQIQSVLIPVAAVTANGQLQEVTVNIPNSSMTELNLILLSKQPISESHIYFSSKDVQFFKSSKYVLMKILEPHKEKLQLKFRGRAGDLVKINLFGNYNLQGEFKLGDGKEPVKGQPVRVESWLTKPGDKQHLGDKDVYSSLSAELVVKKLGGEQKQISVPMTLNADGNGFAADYIFPHEGKYQVHVYMYGSDFYRRTELRELELVNLPPVATAGAAPVELVKSDGTARIKLSDFFTDPNQDTLEFTAEAGNGDSLKAVVDGGELVVTPLRAGDTTIRVTAVDPEGGSTSGEIAFSVSAPWSIYAIIALGAGLALVAGAGLYVLLRPKPKFFGRLEGYFLDTASGNEIPVKYWPLHTLGAKGKISLQELFQQLEVHEILPEAANIWFVPGKNHALLVKHQTKCTVVIGRTPLPAEKTGTLVYNDKLYVTFEDGVTEIEIRYKEPKPNSR